VRVSLAAVTGFALAGAASLCGATARAQLPRRDGFTLQTRMDASVQWQRDLPSTSLPRAIDEGRRVNSGALPSTGPSTLLAYGAGLDFVLRDRYIIPLMAFETAWSLGRRPTVYGAVDGSIVEMHPWKAWQMSVFLGGFGARWKQRRWAFSAVGQAGVSLTFLDVDVASGVEREKRLTLGVHFAARGTGEVCRRLDPVERVCVVGAVNIFQESFFNGGALGLRWEFGP